MAITDEKRSRNRCDRKLSFVLCLFGLWTSVYAKKNEHHASFQIWWLNLEKYEIRKLKKFQTLQIKTNMKVTVRLPVRPRDDHSSIPFTFLICYLIKIDSNITSNISLLLESLQTSFESTDDSIIISQRNHSLVKSIPIEKATSVI